MTNSLGESIKDLLETSPLSKLSEDDQMLVAGHIGGIAQIHAAKAERVRDAALAVLRLLLDFYKSPEAIRRDGEYHRRFIEAIEAAAALASEENASLARYRDFYLMRMDALQRYQHELPEPHRTAICNILANGTVGATNTV
jgi:hypothetical protein